MGYEVTLKYSSIWILNAQPLCRKGHRLAAASSAADGRHTTRTTAAENGDGSRRTLLFSAQRRMEYDGMVLPYGCKRLTNSTQALRRQNYDNLRALRQ